jgi:hypothetical protein
MTLRAARLTLERLGAMAYGGQMGSDSSRPSSAGREPATGGAER